MLESILDAIANSAIREHRILIIGTNLSDINDWVKQKFKVGYINDVDESSYVTGQHFVFRIKLNQHTTKRKLFDAIKKRGEFSEIYIHFVPSCTETLVGWLRELFGTDVPIHIL